MIGAGTGVEPASARVIQAAVVRASMAEGSTGRSVTLQVSFSAQRSDAIGERFDPQLPARVRERLALRSAQQQRTCMRRSQEFAHSRQAFRMRYANDPIAIPVKGIDQLGERVRT